MIDLNKTYKTGDGRKVRLSFIEGDYIHGYIENLDQSVPQTTTWMPYLWVVNSGLPQFATKETEEHPWVDEFKLVECKPTKQVSPTIQVMRDGSCRMGRADVTVGDTEKIFATFTMDIEVSEMSYGEVYHIKPEPDNITSFNITREEAKALQALVCYGDKEFLGVFYEKLGKHYLRPSEKALIGLFDKIRKKLPKTK